MTNEPILPFSLPKEDGFSVEWDERLKGFKINIPHGELFYSKHFFNKKNSDKSIEYFLENNSNNWQTTDWKNLTVEEFKSICFKNIKWKHDSINLFGTTRVLNSLSSPNFLATASAPDLALMRLITSLDCLCFIFFIIF